MLYVKTLSVAGRTPYVLFNRLQETWRGTRGVIFCLSDTWVYRFEPYKVAMKVRCLRSGTFIFRVTHSDGVIDEKINEKVPPGKFYDETFDFYGGSKVGDEVIEFIFEAGSMGSDEKYQFNIPVLEYPKRIVIRREGVVAGRPVTTTRTLPAVRKVTTLGVLGDYEGYERDLRSIFSEYSLKFGEKLEKNIILVKGGKVSSILFDGNLTLKGDIDKLLPLTFAFKPYFRSQEVYRHEAKVFGGWKKGL